VAEWHLPRAHGARFAFVDPDADGVAYIAARLREGDAEEAYATFGSRDYHSALEITLAGARDAVMALNAWGEPIALLGVNTLSLLSNTGSPWAVATHRADGYRRALIAMGRLYTQAMLEHYQTLTNHVDARNAKSVAWLQHIGYSLGEPVPFGPFGLPFHKFQIER
jgi:hypothetical protein